MKEVAFELGHQGLVGVFYEAGVQHQGLTGFKQWGEALTGRWNKFRDNDLRMKLRKAGWYAREVSRGSGRLGPHLILQG